ncbi:MAG: CBS domain-containing protein [Candidatus Micrarchaeota archaeon]|nr:CBS domain-containing protein [Candidatus Micrarchaeota archaeon]
MNASEIMKKEFFYVQWDENIASAAGKMAQKGFSEAPVLNGWKYVGMLHISDLASSVLKTHLFQRPTIRNAREIQNQAVKRYIKRNGHWIKPESDMVSILIYLKKHQNEEIVPVVDAQMRLAGVVYASDVQNEISRILGSGQDSRIQSSGKNKDEKLEGQTPIDQLVNLVQKRGSVGAGEAARLCGLSREEIQDYAKSLEKSNLIAIEYGMFGMKLIRPEKPKQVG